VTGPERAGGGAAGANPARPLLVVTPDGADRDGLLQDLAGRADFRLRYAASAAAAALALREHAVVLLIAAPEVPTAGVSELLISRERIRPDVPVLIVRNRQAEEPASWARSGVGVLRCPLLPAALGRSVEVVLGLRRP
jgi:DNA-binding NtrC family response regulator